MIWINKHKRVWRTAVNYINSQKAARCLVAWLLLGLSGLALISCSTLLTALENAPQTREMALADLDGDGDLDAFLANGRKYESEPNSVLFNDGDGRFSNSGQRLSNDNTFSVALADLDNDGDTDALVGNVGAIGELFRNNGSGQFLSDGDVDAFIAATAMTHPASGETLIIDASGQVWINEGGVQGGELGTFVDSGQLVGHQHSSAVALGDVDADGDLDVYIGYEAADELWLNDGNGFFTNSGQMIGENITLYAQLSDLDGDGDLDLFTAMGRTARDIDDLVLSQREQF